MKIISCKTNHMTSPLGFAFQRPVFSYIIEEAKGTRQTSGRIIVSLQEDLSIPVFDSGWDENMDSLAYEADFLLLPRTRYYWRVFVRTDAGDAGCSGLNWFETGKREEPWAAQWITCDNRESRHPIFHKDIPICKPVASARLYICGLGLYEAYWNGERIGNEWLTPYCNNYHKWLQYQTHDVTAQLQNSGTLSVLLGNGWYKGRFGFLSTPSGNGYYGSTWKLIAELRITYADGSTEIIGTDDTWGVHRSSITASSIYDGEHVDTTAPELPEEAAVLTREEAPLCDRYSLPVRVYQELRPVALIHSPAGETILDLGQNHSGIFRLRIHIPKGQTLRLQFGEVLQNGCFYRDNLRTASADYTWVSDGESHILTPHFTFYGYRYVKVEGIPELHLEDYTGLVLCSELPKTGILETGHTLVNQLISNAEWGLLSNFLDVPTDCPQRDERMGWTGDAQVFSPTACFQHDSYAFYCKYLRDLYTEQQAHEGMVPDVVPSFGVDTCSCAWGDAACIIPWNLYLFYGDISILRQQYDSMKAWVDYIHKVDGDCHGWRKQLHYGDWLALDNTSGKPGGVRGGTDEAFIADVYYRMSARIVAKSAALLGLAADAEKYQSLYDRLSREIRAEYYSKTGRCCINTQTAAILTLREHLCENEDRVARQLVQLIRDQGTKLTTGFVGTPFLNLTLSAIGERELAYQLLLNENYPGWLYAVKLGATTIWERWNSILPDGSISSTGMNSLNHYAYGSILEWLWRRAAGLNPVPDHPGFRTAEIRPEPDLRLKSMNAVYNSPCGTYRVEWQAMDNTTIHLSITVPFGSEASLYLPLVDASTLDDPGNPMLACIRDGACILHGGTYSITYTTAHPIHRIHTIAEPVCDLLNNPDTRRVLEEAVPGIDPPYKYASLPLEELLCTFGASHIEETLTKISNGLSALYL